MKEIIGKLRFDWKSFVVFVALFVGEVLIAVFIHDGIVRPYMGDVLVVIMIYYFVKAFFRVKPLHLVIGVVLFAFLVEFGQYMHLIEVLGLNNNVLARTVLGYGFSWVDMFAYTLGGAICYFIDRKAG